MNDLEPKFEKAAEIIARWTWEAGTMLPKTPDNILTFIRGGRYVIRWNGDETPAGFGAITFEWPDNWLELGCVVVEPNHRERGLGHVIVADLVSLAKTKDPFSRLFALCNSRSLKLFLDAGGVVITDHDLLPSEVWGECVHCPMRFEAQKINKLCCDTPVEIK
jgi:N-acetylglutamate synthase-like GNAT family acetyltransferase